MPPSQSQRDLFLCHNKADKDWAKKLGSRIESEELGGKKLSVFLDEWDIEVGENIVLKLNDGLKQSRFVGLLLSPEMLASDWCALEYSWIIAQDPGNRRGRLIPLLVRETHRQTGVRIDIPPILMPLNFLDFRDEKQFERPFARLLARLRGEPPLRGGARLTSPEQSKAITTPLSRALGEERVDPDPVDETLVSNVLPVNSMPPVVWTAPTKMKLKSDVPQGLTLPPFIIREGRIVSFADLSGSDGPFTDFLATGEWARHTLSEWRKSRDKWRWVVELMNISLKAHLGRFQIGFEPKSRRFYFRRQGDKSVRLKWGAGDTRTVVRAPDAGLPGGNWVHQAAWLRFETLGSNIFLSVEATWMFTRDGREPVPSKIAGPLAMQWGGKERNGAVLRNVLMWSDVLAWGRSNASIQTGDKPIVLGRAPALTGISVGIVDDHVAVQSLLKFTKAEQELDVATGEGVDEGAFGYVDDQLGRGEDGGEEI